MKCLLSFLFILFGLVNGTSQLNEQFENWEFASVNPPFNWNYPNGWSTSNPVTEFASFSVVRSVESHSGNYAALIQSVPVFNTYLPGVLMLGKATYNYGLLTMKADSGVSLQQIPAQLSGWYKLQTPDTSMYAVIKVVVVRFGNGAVDSILLDSTMLLAPVEDYTFFSMPISDGYILNPELDRLFVTFRSFGAQEVPAPAFLWVDDVEVDFISKVEEIEKGDQIRMTIRPNITTAGQPIQLNFNEPLGKPATIYLIDCTGNISQKFYCPSFSTHVQIETKELVPGKYWIQSEHDLLMASFVIQ